MLRTSIFIVPRASSAWKGNEAGWITTSGWAAAGKQLWGDAMVATSDGVFTPEESRLFPVKGIERKSSSAVWRRLIPESLITAYKDYSLWRSRPAIWPIEKTNLSENNSVALVWERHDLFPGPGRRLADKLRVPLITSVEAVVVWEARRWGVHRPLYGRWLERQEAASLGKSDLVMCVSEEIRRRVIELGVTDSKVIVTPNRVDSTLFHPGVDRTLIRKGYNLEGKKVIGWTGSFRRFHGLPILIQAFHQVHQRFPDSLLMLVGDGQELEATKHEASRMGLSEAIVFAGRQPFPAIPSFVAAFDVGLVSASSSSDFHYSPLKLREYLAVGKAIVAPKAGDLPKLFRADDDMLFYEPGNADDLANALCRILEDSVLKEKLESRALQLFQQEGTWVHELKRVCELLPIQVPGYSIQLNHSS